MIIIIAFSFINNSEKVDFAPIEKLVQSERIKILVDNKESLDRLVSKDKEQFAKNFPNLFNDYLAVKIGDNPKLNQPNGGEKISTYKDFDSDYGYWYYSQFYFTNRSEGIIVYNDIFETPEKTFQEALKI